MGIEHDFYATMLEDLRYIRAHSSRTAELLATGVHNSVLEVRTVTFPEVGFIQYSWGATCGSIAVRNLSPTEEIVVASGPGGTTPTGVGSWTVPPNVKDVVSVNSRTVTLYGTQGHKLCFQAFTVAAGPKVS